MKSLIEHFNDIEQESSSPQCGDGFDFEIQNSELLESYVIDIAEDGIVVAGDDQLLNLLSEAGCRCETIRRYGAVGKSMGTGFVVDDANSNDPLMAKSADDMAVPAMEDDIDEAEYHGRSVPLNKPMQGDVKKSKVYVKNPGTGKVVKVNFGDPDMTIKKSNPARRRSFRARHNCDNPGPKTKARYWSCRAW